MSFTTRNGATTCDCCKRPVGSTWRQRADHVCARLIDTIKRAQGQAS